MEDLLYYDQEDTILAELDDLTIEEIQAETDRLAEAYGDDD